MRVFKVKERPKILFTIGALDNGGVAKSLLSLLSVIDKKQYDISLLIAGHDCGRNKDVPGGITKYTNSVLADVVGGVNGLNGLLRSGHLLLLLGSLFRLFLSRVNRGWAGWWISRLMPKVIGEEFDLIVDYNGQHMLYYMIDKLKAQKKVTFFHSDYKKWRYYENMDRCYFKHVDIIFTVSERCVLSLETIFPEFANKIKLMENINSPILIDQMSKQPIAWTRKHKHVFISLGHVCINKGSDLAMEVALRLRELGIDYEWLFLGDISNDMDFLGFINKNKLQNNVYFLGNIKNPYPYIRQADIFVHLSRFEGKSIALEEAKLMCKPIVVTNFSTVNDQFINNVNASICEMKPSNICQNIINLIQNNTKRNKYIRYLQDNKYYNRNEVEKLYQLIKSK